MIIAGIATRNIRDKQLVKTLTSLENQSIKFDKIYIYNNDVNVNYTDNAKFLGLKYAKPGDYYFSLDDDIFYYKDYVKDSIATIESNMLASTNLRVLTRHGRILDKNEKHYHLSNKHEVFNCFTEHDSDHFINVLGTGVSCYLLNEELIERLYNVSFDSKQKMTDLLVSYILTDMNIPIFLKSVNIGDFTDLNTTIDGSCYQNGILNNNEYDEEMKKIIKRIYE